MNELQVHVGGDDNEWSTSGLLSPSDGVWTNPVDVARARDASGGYLAREHVFYGSEEGVDFTNICFYTVLFHALRASNRIAIERGAAFDGFADLAYASGEFFDKYIDDLLRRVNGSRAVQLTSAGHAVLGSVLASLGAQH